MHEHHHPIGDAIDRGWRYWLDGNGQWMPRWECTGHDVLLLVVSLTTASVMVAGYFVYAHQQREAIELLPTEPERQHARDLQRVFLLCGLLHWLHVVGWFHTLYYLVAMLYGYNAWQTYRLTCDKNRLLALQAMRKRHADRLAREADGRNQSPDPTEDSDVKLADF